LTGQAIVGEAITMARADEDELELAVREHARLVYRIAYSVLRNHHDAEDATQETFIRVLRYRRQLCGVREPRTWLARIAWRVAVGRQKKVSEVSLDDVETVAIQLRSTAAGAEKIVLQNEMSAVLEKLIAALPTKLRGPLVLSTVDELSPSDIGEVLGLTEAAVRSSLFRARQILHEILTTLDSKHGTR
jgi:RNA polymerase sigma-70 factor (ECF subfamily)